MESWILIIYELRFVKPSLQLLGILVQVEWKEVEVTVKC